MGGGIGRRSIDSESFLPLPFLSETKSSVGTVKYGTKMFSFQKRITCFRVFENMLRAVHLTDSVVVQSERRYTALASPRRLIMVK